MKLCDFASAAPFSLYDGRRRRIHHAFSCLVGTPDYIAPDILIAEEDRINATARNDRFAADDDISISGFTSFSKSRLPISEPEPESEGQYGPEIDWWSTGVVIYEMVYKNVPFWADSIREAHYRIRNHQQFLKLDESVRISQQLASLIRGLLCERDQRLGASIDGTHQVMQHPFFNTVDWNNYLDAPAPFVPNVSPAALDPAIPESPSCLHSPRPVAGRQSALADQSYSMTPESFQLSQIYEGNLEDFPAYESSRDGVIQEGSDEEEEDFGVAHTVYSEGNEQEQVKQTSPIVSKNGVSNSPVVPKPLQGETFNWSDVDVTCLGFSAFPGADAFGSSSRTLPSRLASLPAMTPVISRMRSFTTIMEASPVCYSAAASPEVWMRQDAEGPTTSTPYAGRPNFSSPAMGANSSYRAPPTPLISSTPYGSAPKVLQRRVLESAGRGAASPGDGFFATPLRKTSMPNVASAFRQGQTPAVPASPYPFPMAVRATPRTVERRGLASVSRSIRMTSQTPSYGQGMDSNADSGSRCSGGSNAKRDVSENEAMEQLMRVVAQSARKVRIEREDRAVNERLLALENTLAAKQGLETSLQQRLLKPTRPGLTHRSTDSALETTKEEIETGPWTASQRRGSAPGLSVEAIEEAKEEPESNEVASPPPVVSDLPSRPPRKLGLGQRKPSQALLNRLPSVPAPPVISLPTSVQVSSGPMSPDESSDSDSDSEPDSPLGSRPSSTMGGYFGRHASSSSSSTSHSSLAQAASSSSGAGHNNELRAPRMGLPQLRSRRSNRQLKMEAQERTTPTRPARVNSPFLNPPEFEMSRLSLGAEGVPSPSFRFEETGDNTPALSDGETSSGAEGEPLSADVSLLSNAGSRPSLQAAHHHTYPQVVRKTRLSLPALDAPVDIRSRSSSSGQLASMQRSSSSASQLDDHQTDSGKQGRSSVEPSSRGLRRKESRETLSEYRKGLVGSASQLQKGKPDGEGSLGGVVNIDDAFGGGLATLPPALRKTLRRASVANLGREYDRATQSTSPPTTLITNENGKIASQGSQLTLSATGGMAGKGQGPRRRCSALPLHSSSINLRRSFMQSEDSIQEEASAVTAAVPSGLTKNDVKDTNSPLTKMGQRYGGLNREMSRLEQRLASVKRRLAD